MSSSRNHACCCSREGEGSLFQIAEAGIDPRSVRLEEARQLAEERRSTFDGRVTEFIERHVDQRLRSSTAGEYRRVSDRVSTSIDGTANRSARLVGKTSVTLFDEIGERGKPGAANLTFAYLRKFLNWCVEREVIEVNPMGRMKAPFALQSRDRVLTDEELCLLTKAFDLRGWSLQADLMVAAADRTTALRDHRTEVARGHRSRRRTPNARLRSFSN